MGREYYIKQAVYHYTVFNIYCINPSTPELSTGSHIFRWGCIREIYVWHFEHHHVCCIREMFSTKRLISFYLSKVLFVGFHYIVSQLNSSWYSIIKLHVTMKWVVLMPHVCQILESNVTLEAAIWIEVFRGFSQFVQANAGILPEIQP